MKGISSQIVIGFLFIFCALFAVSSSANDSVDTLSNDFKISFNKSGPTIPCICRRGDYNGFSSAEEEQQLVVSVTTDTAVHTPLKFRYEVSGGKILDEGPVVVWDFADLAPGNYKVTVKVTDETDPVGKTLSTTVKLSEAPVCDCGHSCPEITVRSNMISARAGDKVRFRALLFGEDLFDRQLKYQWKISNGKITAGQGSREIEVLVDRKAKEPEIAAEVKIAGLDPTASCPNNSSGSVNIGTRSLLDKSGSGALNLNLDETMLVIACPLADKGCIHQSSPDAIIDVRLESFGSRGNSSYSYLVTGGKIIGSGTRVRWDLTHTPPGSYKIEAKEIRDRKPIGKTLSKVVTVVSKGCICDPACPYISLSSQDRVAQPGRSFNVSASVSGGSQDRPLMFNWTVSDGEIVSGQGSPFLTVRVPNKIDKQKVKVELNVGGMDPYAGCAKNFVQVIPVTGDER